MKEEQVQSETNILYMNLYGFEHNREIINKIIKD